MGRELPMSQWGTRGVDPSTPLGPPARPRFKTPALLEATILARRAADDAVEGAHEIRQVVESDVVRNLGDRSRGVALVARRVWGERLARSLDRARGRVRAAS